jgi:hypothetical protein
LYPETQISKLFDHERGKLKGEWRTVHNDKLYKLNLDIITAPKNKAGRDNM